MEDMHNKGKAMSVIEYIDELLLEEERINAILFQAAVKLLEEDDSSMSYNALRSKLKDEFPEVSAYDIRVAAGDAKDYAERHLNR